MTYPNLQPDAIRIAYIQIHYNEDSSIRGGLLVVDEKLRPFEFRITSPIKPTELQIILYGSSLSEYVYSELIFRPLVQSTKEKLSLVVTKDRNFLNLRPLIEVPVIYLSEKKEKDSLPINSSGSESPIGYINCHRKFMSELQPAQKLILEVCNEVKNIHEPFERLRTALIEVHRLKPESSEK